MSLTAPDISSGTPPSSTQPHLRVRAHSGWQGVGWRELWEHRELLGFLAWRDVRVRYKQTLLGAGWAILQPLLSMIVFTLFFGGLLKVPSEGLPYAVFTYAALVPWNYFSQSLGGAAGSLVGNAGLVTKVYFPRLVLPVAGLIARLVDFGAALLVIFALMLYYRLPILPALALLPAFLLLAMGVALGVGLWLAAINVYYRDVQVLVPFLLQLWMFATPVVYSSTLLSGPWRILYSLNPMVAVIDGFRWCLLGTAAPGASLWAALGVTLVLLVSGVVVFTQTQRTMADVV
jgi:homopolymeric O-antigen transport system permease protein